VLSSLRVGSEKSEAIELTRFSLAARAAAATAETGICMEWGKRDLTQRRNGERNRRDREVRTSTHEIKRVPYLQPFA
jgi:hypothetical protein